MSSYFARMTGLVIVGAVVNVFVAWGCVLWSSWRSVEAPYLAEDDRRMRELAAPKNDDQEYIVIQRTNVGFDYLILGSIPRDLRGPPRRAKEHWHVIRAGWPFRSLACERRVGIESEDAWKYAWPRVGSLEPIARDVHRRLPLQASVMPFIANSVIYAGIAWLSLVVVRTIRHGTRRRRGLCSRCGYRVGADPVVCPECGQSC